MLRRFLAGIALALFVTGPVRADDPKYPDANEIDKIVKYPDSKEFDKIVLESLKTVHNVGADLYNTSRDYAGAYRVYQGALVTVRPLLSYRPAAQRMIDDGLSAAEKEPGMGLKAFKLHETIEEVRTLIKSTPATKPAEPKKAQETKPAEPTKPVETKKPSDIKKVGPAPQFELAPQPRVKMN